MVKLSGCALLAVVLLSAAGDLSAGSGSEAGVVLTAPSSGRGVHSRETGRLEQIFEKLSLTDEQKLSVKTIIATADPSMKSLREQIDANKSKLWNMQPDDPNYASAVRAAYRRPESAAGDHNGRNAVQYRSARGRGPWRRASRNSHTEFIAPNVEP
jgi:Spy/CpxP family protein refolding chaperone